MLPAERGRGVHGGGKVKAWAKFLLGVFLSAAAGGMFGLAVLVFLRHKFGL